VSEVNWLRLKQTGDDATKPLEVGRYRFRCERPAYRQAQTGAPMIVVHLVVQGGPKHGKDLMHNFVLSVDNAFALSRWFANFEAFGLGEEFWQKLSETGYTQEQALQVVAQTIDGRIVEAEVGQREFRGSMRNEFNAFYPVPGQPVVNSPLVSVPTGSGAPTPGMTPSVPSGVPSVTPSVPSSAPSGVPSIPTPHVSPVSTPAPTSVSAPPEEPF
jgi:hypothetical protein